MITRPYITFFLLIAWPLAAAHGEPSASVTSSGIFVPEAWARQGIHRQWYSQVQLDGHRHQIAGMTLYGGRLYVGTTSGLVHAFDAESGETLWKQAYGKPYYPFSPPGFNEEFAAFQRGTTLFVAARDTGAVVWEKTVKGMLGVAPAVLDDRVLVALPVGKIESYSIAEPTQLPQVIASFGRVSTSPIVSDQHMIWATDRAKIMVRGRGRNATQREITIPAPIEAPMTVEAGMLYAAAMDGNVYCIRESDANFVWIASADGPIRQRQVLANDALYVVTDARTLYCLDAKSGTTRWECPGVHQIVSVGAHRIFAMDDLDRLLVIDRGTGHLDEAVLVNPASVTFTNTQTDRCYLSTPDGLLTCLREAEQTEPLSYDSGPSDADDEATPAPADEATQVPTAEAQDEALDAAP